MRTPIFLPARSAIVGALRHCDGVARERPIRVLNDASEVGSDAATAKRPAVVEPTGERRAIGRLGADVLDNHEHVWRLRPLRQHDFELSEREDALLEEFPQLSMTADVQ